MQVTSYLERIKYPKGTIPPEKSISTLYKLHSSHVLVIPFENLDIHRNKNISLLDTYDSSALERIYHKLVTQRRGGFCFEHNRVFYWIMQELGFTNSWFVAARVFEPVMGTWSRYYSHCAIIYSMCIRNIWSHSETDEGNLIFCDVGFGSSCLEPLRLVVDEVQTQSDSHQLKFELHEEEVDNEIVPLYYLLYFDKVTQKWTNRIKFQLKPTEFSSFEHACQFVQGPEAMFSKKIVVSIRTPSVRKTLAGLKYVTTIIDSKDNNNQQVRTEKELTEEEFYKILTEEFGIVLDDEGKYFLQLEKTKIAPGAVWTNLQ